MYTSRTPAHSLCAALWLFVFGSTTAAFAQDLPTIRFGRQTAAEDNLLLMMVKPELAPNLGKAYKIEYTQFRASDIALKAFETNSVDLMTTSVYSAIAARARGIDLKLIASIARESSNGAKTNYIARTDGPKSVADLKGKTIGILGYRTATELYARVALQGAGLNPDRDVQWALVPFSAVPEAVRSGKVDAGGVVDLFWGADKDKGDLKVLFTSKTGIPYDEELIAIAAQPAFLAKNGAAVRAFLSDLTLVTTHFLQDVKGTRQILLDAKMVALPPAIYMAAPEYVKDPTLRLNVEVLEKQVDVLIAAGFIDKKVDVRALVDTSYLGGG